MVKHQIYVKLLIIGILVIEQITIPIALKKTQIGLAIVRPTESIVTLTEVKITKTIEGIMTVVITEETIMNTGTDTVKIGFWNVNGWSANDLSENSMFREKCIDSLNLDIVCIAETHLFRNQFLKLQNYVFLVTLEPYYMYM
jgi:hypothetical protein